MPKLTIKETIPASCKEVFDVVHDYSRRLEWDTLLQAAYLEGGDRADIGVVAVCVGKTALMGLEIRTAYVSFQPGKVAAVKLSSPAPFFEAFAASIRHFDLGHGWSEIIYELNYKAKPAFIRPLMHPIMSKMLKWETRKRLRSLKRYIEENQMVVSVECSI
jgi:hypothetical protein